MKRRRGHDVPAADLGIKHGKAIVVFRRDHDVFHPGILGKLHPGIGVEFHRIPLLRQLLILGHRNMGAIHDPLSQSGNLPALPFSGRDGIESPVDEKTVLGVFEPG